MATPAAVPLDVQEKVRSLDLPELEALAVWLAELIASRPVGGTFEEKEPTVCDIDVWIDEAKVSCQQGPVLKRSNTANQKGKQSATRKSLLDTSMIHTNTILHDPANGPLTVKKNRHNSFFDEMRKLDHVWENEKFPETRERELVDFELARNDAPVVQFSAPMYFGTSAAEDEHMVLDVIRIGRSDEASEISYRTECGSAKKGAQFIESEGKVVFAKGSNTEHIELRLVPSKLWDTTLEFKVALSEDPAARKNCELGAANRVARVKVINDHCFPSDKYAKDIKIGGDHVRNMAFWGIFWEYVKLNFSIPIVRRGTKKFIMVDFAHNLYLLLSLFVNVYLVDEVLKKKDVVDAELKLIVLAAMLIVPYAGLHFIDFRKTMWKVGGASRARLQNAVLCKFQNYDRDARSHLEKSELIMGMTRDCPSVVHEGYIKLLSGVRSAGNLVAVLIFQLSAPAVFKLMDSASTKKIPLMGLGVLVAFPALVLPFLLVRRRTTTSAVKEQQHAMDAIVQQVDNTVNRYRLIADYAQRPYYEEKFANKVKDYNKVRVGANQVLTNNRYASQWLSNLFMAAYIIIGGTQVVNDSSGEGLGMFLANLSIIKTIGTAWGAIYNVVMDIEIMSPDFKQITIMLNLSTDVRQRKAVNRDRRGRTKAMREKLLAEGTPGFPLDNLPIILKNMAYSYGDKLGFKMNGEIFLHQGEFVSFVGPVGEGKATLLQLLAQVLFPDDASSLFVPSHLRVLNVAQELLFIKESLFNNLTFGSDKRDVVNPDPRMDRVVRICERLHIPPDLIDIVKQGPNGSTHDWMETISNTNKNLLMLARALVLNPHVLCLHKPLVAYDEGTAEVVLHAVMEFCTNKGFQLDAEDRHTRRPRTCVMTTHTMESALQCDRIYLVENSEGGVVAVPKKLAEQFTDYMGSMDQTSKEDN